MKRRVAIVGGGIAGLSAAHFLHPHHEIALFEKSPRLGGNAYTLRSRDGESVDIAVAAFGRAGYPNFYRLLDDLGVATRACAGSFMSFHDLDKHDGLYLTPGWRGLRRQGFDVLRPQRLAALVEVGLRLADGVRRERAGELDGLTVEQGLDRLRPLTEDARTVVLCVFCLLSSMSAREVLAAPAAFFFRKIAKHNDVVSPRAVYSVRAVEGRTQSYVTALAAPLQGRITLNASIASVRRHDAGVRLVFSDGRAREFDDVVFACNADQALALLAEPTDQERALLGAWRYKDGRVVVHRDHAAFPSDELMQAYTFLFRRSETGAFDTSVNGSLRHEPGVSPRCEMISSQHPNFPIDPAKIELDTVLRTPIFDFAACATQARLPLLNGVKHTYYCGSHFGFGLHEDAVSSALAVATALDVPAGARPHGKRRKDRSLVGSHVLITGAAGGIGTALSRCLLERGAAGLVLVDRDATRLEALAHALSADHDEARISAHVVDLTDAKAVDGLIQRLTDQAVDVLINNAGMAIHGRFEAAPVEQIDAVIGLNLLASMRLTRAMLPLLRRRPWACIVNVSSAAGLAAPGGLAVYAASKAGLVGFSQALRIELAAENIDVLAMCPGFVRTNLLHHSRAALSDSAQASRKLDAVVRRAGLTPEAVARRTCRAIERGERVVVMELWVKAVLGLAQRSPAAAERLGRLAYRALAKWGGLHE